MKFTKGLVVGGLLATGLLMMYNDTDILNKNKMMKKQNMKHKMLL